MDFVNHLGKPIDIAALKQSVKRTSRPAAASFHKGWRAVGFSPEQLERARKEHLELAQKLAATGRSSLPWDEDRYMRHHKPGAIRSAPYSTQEAADLACGLAARAGWKGCTSVPVAKGS